ncbi:MAG: thiamine pyrophosphate-dependent dehydrogenase E1 component subunit alpha [Natronomonas sp.]
MGTEEERKEGSDRYRQFCAGTDIHRRLDADGAPLSEDYEPPLSDSTLRDMYRDMRLCRHFDERMISLQRQGRVGTFASAAGQEGAQMGSMYALEDDDPILYQYREHGAVVDRDGLAEYVEYWMGQESGNAGILDYDIFPLNISVGSHIPHATGMAWAVKLKGDDRVVVCHFGEGATSEGDFHEGVNFAGVFDVPAVFVCNNNGWAISVPESRQTASDSFGIKAAAYGIEGRRVDGMDPLATYEVMNEAVQRARDDTAEVRPTLVETVGYRFGAHTTADDPTVYREEAEVERWKRWDPISRLEGFLRRREVLDDEGIETIEDEIQETVSAAITAAEETSVDPEDLFADAYAEQTPRVREDAERFRELRDRYGEEALGGDE